MGARIIGKVEVEGIVIVIIMVIVVKVKGIVIEIVKE